MNPDSIYVGPLPSIDNFNSETIAYLNEMHAGEVVQLNVVPHFEADMPLTIASLAGRPLSATATVVAAIIRQSIAA